MKLSKLTLHGYKTFASKTVFEFNEGITAIVGPNGSGKSNIADAIRWVLGEQSYGTLRGKRTTDMIFAGSQQRPRAGMAQAILTLDNSAGWIPLDFNEIEISRRAYRSGENEYLLNGQKVRLRDVIDLLASSGLAQHNYTIISQGLVDQALSLRSDERRLLFEGAAGVSQYKLRRTETIRRLQETDHNLERLNDILSEIKPRLGSLRRQADRAKNYEQIAADLKYHLRIWYGYRWEDARKQLLACREERQKSRQQWEHGQQMLATSQEQMDELRGQVYDMQRALQYKEEERNSLRDQVAAARQSVAVIKERQDSIRSQLDDLTVEIPAIVVQHERAHTETNQAISELQVAQAEYDDVEIECREFESNTLTVQAEIKRLQGQIVEFDRTKNILQKEIAEGHGKKELVKTLIERLISEPGVDDQYEEARAEVERLTNAEDSARDNLGHITNKVAELRLSLATIEQATAKLIIQHQAAESRHYQKRDTVLTLQTRLEELHRQKGIIPEVTGNFDIVGQFSELVFIPEQFRVAVTAALTYKLAAYTVPDSKSFWKLIKKAEGLPIMVADLSMLKVPEKISISNQPGIIGWADSLVKPEEESRGLVQLMLGHVLIVDDALVAYDLAFKLPPGALAVSLDGFVAFSGGLVQIAPDPVFSNISSPGENIVELQEELEKETDNLGKFSEELVTLAAAVEESRGKLESMNKTIVLAENHEKSVTFETLEIKRSRELAEQQLRFISKRMETARTEVILQRDQLRMFNELLANKESEAEELEIILLESRQELNALPIAATTTTRGLNLQRIEAARTILAGRQAVVDSRRATLNQLADQLRRREERKAELENRSQELKIDEHIDKLEINLANLAQIEESIGPLRKKLADDRKRQKLIEDELANLQRRIRTLENDFMQARMEFGRVENQLESLRERITADLGLVALSNADDLPTQSPLPMAAVVEELPVVTSLPDDIEETVSKYRGQLTRMGPVNLDAPGEYEETSERYDFMQQQVQDLSTTKQRLEVVIDDLDQLTSTAFAETVRRVDQEFGNVFKRLFGGGSAQLVLTDPDDLTLSGVDIVARLPRRREQGLALLSGGERSLTATALIFSLLKVSPTPFCILDEVDAMLDEANVNRFRDLLNELSDKTQFILITHNRGTVQVAETVYGISMGADSVSQVISIRPEDYLAQKV
ncbi:MAG TPA: chromosome segregation protein SMC [Patescibacteria group bacterium]|nr:chromosome segregation protein SMC [Patescibacteria group bacterium]